jgi:hypothetical protein
VSGRCKNQEFCDDAGPLKSLAFFVADYEVKMVRRSEADAAAGKGDQHAGVDVRGGAERNDQYLRRQQLAELRAMLSGGCGKRPALSKNPLPPGARF